VQVKLWDPLWTSAIPERLEGVITIRCYTNPSLPYLTLPCAKTHPVWAKKRKSLQEHDYQHSLYVLYQLLKLGFYITLH